MTSNSRPHVVHDDWVFYWKVKICNPRYSARIAMLKSLCDNGVFFDMNVDRFYSMLNDVLGESSLSQIHDAYIALVANREARAREKDSGLLSHFVDSCFNRSNVSKLCTPSSTPRSPEEFEAKLQLFQKNGFLHSFVWGLPGFPDLEGHYCEMMLKYKVPTRPNLHSGRPGIDAGPTSDLTWFTHFTPLVRHFKAIALERAKKNAFRKLYFRCFACAFKDPLGAARKRENERAAVDFEDAVSKCMRK